MTTLDEYLKTNLKNFDSEFLRRKYQKQITAEDGVEIIIDDDNDPVLKLKLDSKTLRINNNHELTVIKDELEVKDGDYYCSEGAQGVLIYYYDYSEGNFTPTVIDICVESMDTKFYKYGFTVNGYAKIVVKVGGKFYVLGTKEGANAVNKDMTEQLSYANNAIYLNNVELEVEKILKSEEVSNEEVFPIKETNWA